jgi:hypothetical protein
VTSVSGVGSKQVYTGVPLSIDKKQPIKYEKVPFECHRCAQIVDSEKGYFVEHYRVKQDRYGAHKRILCAASNNKVRAELRTLSLTGECDQCNTEMTLEMTEEFPGGLQRYGGFMKQNCTICDGRKHATCEECGQILVEIESVDNSLGTPITTTAWVHDADNKPECDNAGTQFFVVDYDQPIAPTGVPGATAPATAYTPVAGPFPDQPTAQQEQNNLEQAPTATGNENYGLESTPVAGTNAKAFALSIKQNPVNEVLLYDGFEIEERDDDAFSTPEPTFDPSDPASIAAALSGTDAQEG